MAEELTLEARVENLDRVLALLNSQLEECDCAMKTQMQLEVAVEELFVNIAHYAYAPAVGNATVRVELRRDPSAVFVTFIDRGIPYNPLMKEDPDISQSADERKVGGLGIYMVKKSMDDMAYEYRDGQNILTIRKDL